MNRESFRFLFAVAKSFIHFSLFNIHFPLRRLRHGRLDRPDHILNENPVSRRRVVDEDVRHRADELAVLYQRAAAHECVQVGTTVFFKNFTETSAKNTLSRIF